MTADAFDALTRHQIYLEGVKDASEDEIEETHNELGKMILALLLGLSIDTLNQLTKTQLVVLIKKVRKKQEAVWKNYVKRAMAYLERFAKTDFRVTDRLFAYLQRTDEAGRPSRPIYGPKAVDGSAGGLDRLFAIIKGEPLAATGGFMLPTIKEFASRSIIGIERVIRQGWANGWKVSDAVKAILGTKSKNYRDGLFAKQKRDHSAIMATNLQHASQIVQAAIASQFYSRYEWSSVLDDRTTDICRSRDGIIYNYGEGPLPPAHVRCRSSIVPITGKKREGSTFWSWLKRQPSGIQDDIVGKTNGTNIRSGELKAADYKGFKDRKPLSLDEFEKKLERMTE